MIAAFIGVVCLGYFCIVSKDRSVTLKSQSSVAWQPSQTQSNFNHTNMAMRNIFHHEPVNRMMMGKLTSLSDKSADNVIDNGNKRNLIFTSAVNQKEASRNISDIIHMVNIYSGNVRACVCVVVCKCMHDWYIVTLHFVFMSSHVLSFPAI